MIIMILKKISCTQRKNTEKVEELKSQLILQLDKFDHPYPMEKQKYLETEEFKKLAKKNYEVSPDFIYWWNPEERELPPGYQ